MRCVTWARDSHGLFDYESKYITKTNLKTSGGGKLIRIANEIDLVSKNQPVSEFGEQAKPLFLLHERNGRFLIENDTKRVIKERDETKAVQDDQDYNNKMFLVVRSLKVGNQKVDYTLQKGDIMKVGRIKFKVKDFRTDNEPAQEESSPIKI